MEAGTTPYVYPLKIEGDCIKKQRRLWDKGIESGVWYGMDCILLPIHPLLLEEDLLEIIRCAREVSGARE